MLITNFSSGELSETLFGRTDLPQYYSYCAEGSFMYRIAIPRSVYSVTVYIPKIVKNLTSFETLTTSSARCLILARSYNSIYPAPPYENKPKIVICLAVYVTGPIISYFPSDGKDLLLAYGISIETQLDKTTAAISPHKTNFIFIIFLLCLSLNKYTTEAGKC